MHCGLAAAEPHCKTLQYFRMRLASTSAVLQNLMVSPPLLPPNIPSYCHTRCTLSSLAHLVGHDAAASRDLQAGSKLCRLTCVTAALLSDFVSGHDDDVLLADTCRYLAVENHSMTRWAAEMNATGELPSSDRPCLSIVEARNGSVIQVGPLAGSLLSYISQ